MPRQTTLVPSTTTREVLLVTAERLYATQGIDRVSLRQIGEAAGRRQTAAVQYHFGDVGGLLRAIVEHRTRAANDPRTEMLDDIVLSGRQDDVHALLEAVVFPLLETLPADSHYLGFVAELQARQRIEPIFSEPGTEYGDNARRIRRYLDGALRDVPVDLRTRRIQRGVEVLLSSLARDWEPTEQRRRTGDVRTDPVVADLLGSVAAMLRAPVPRATSRPSRRRLS